MGHVTKIISGSPGNHPRNPILKLLG